MDKYIELYLDTQTNSKTTRTGYYKDLNSMMKFVNKPVMEITQFDIMDWKKAMENLSSATVARRIGTVKRFFKFLYENDFIEKDIMKSIKLPKVVNQDDYLLTADDMHNILNACHTKKDKAIVSMLASTGLRASELCSIHLSDIDDEHNIEVLGKGQKLRYIHINDKAYMYLSQYLDSRTDDIDSLFISENNTPLSPRRLREHIQRIGKRAGINGLHCHMFRHFFGTGLLDAHLPIEQISLVLGHSSVATTQRYAHIRNKKDVVVDVMNIELF